MKKVLWNILVLLSALFLYSESLYAAGERIQNDLLGLQYDTDSAWEVGYSHVERGYGFFEYVYELPTDVAIAVIANNLVVTQSVDNEQANLIRSGGVDKETIAGWFSLEPEFITTERINGQDYLVFPYFYDGEDWIYFMTYKGVVEYQFCMPAKTKAQAGLIRDFLKTISFTEMILLSTDDVILNFDEIDAVLTVPYNSVYYHRGQSPSHPNWLRSFETHGVLNEWMKDTNTYAYLVSEDVFFEIHFYTVQSFENVNFFHASESDMKSVGAGIKERIEGEGNGVQETGIYKGKNMDFVSLQIQDVKGYDSKYYYTSDGATGFVLECYYYEQDEHEAFLEMYKGIVDVFAIRGGETAGNNGNHTETNQTGNNAVQGDNTGSGIPFSDINGHWAAQSILAAYERGLVSGMGGGKFSPDTAVTRGEFIQMIVNLLDLKGNGTSGFKDVSPGEWFFNGITGAEQAGLLEGLITRGAYLEPNISITREEMGVILGNAVLVLGLPSERSERIQFQDYGAIHPDYINGVQSAVNAGLMSGMGEDQFAPKATSTRAQAAQVLINVITAQN